MVEMLDSYLKRLEAKLLTKLPKDVADEHVKEIGAHLRESIQERISAGESEQTATESALRHIGSDALVADGLIYAHSDIAKKSVWQLAWIPALLVFIFWCAPILAPSAFAKNAVTLPWIICIPGAFAYSFCSTCIRSRRFVMAPIGAAMALLLLIYAIQFQVSWRQLYDEQSVEVAARVARVPLRTHLLQSAIQTGISLEQAWKSTDSAAGPKSLIAPKRVAGNGWSPSVDPAHPTPSFELVAAHSASEAKLLWKQNGRRYLSELNQYLTAERRVTAAAVDPGPPQMGPALLAWAEGTVGILAALATLNILLIAIPRRRRNLASERWKPAPLS